MWVGREKKRIQAHVGKEETQEEAVERKQKVGYKLMQRYYHRGAFYQAGDGETGDADLAESAKQLRDTLAQRDFNMPTAQDKQDYSLLPGVLQRRAGTFGRKGQSKWTHLAAEDTAPHDVLWKTWRSEGCLPQWRL